MENLDALRDEFLKDSESCVSVKDIEELRLKYLGRKGLLAQFRKNVDFKSLSPEMRGSFGKGFNDLKNLFYQYKFTRLGKLCPARFHSDEIYSCGYTRNIYPLRIKTCLFFF